MGSIGHTFIKKCSENVFLAKMSATVMQRGNFNVDKQGSNIFQTDVGATNFTNDSPH